MGTKDMPMISAEPEVIVKLTPENLIEIVAHGCINAADRCL
jgi:hypothetical protein